jgi:hypothetical protein
MIMDNLTDNHLLEYGITSYMYSDMSGSMTVSVWNDVMTEKMIAPDTLSGYVKDEERPKTWIIPRKLFDALLSKCSNAKAATAFVFNSDKGIYTDATASDTQMEVLDHSRKFLNECKFPITERVRIVDFETKSILASVNKDEILLSLTALDKGVHVTAVALIEEHMHIKSKEFDETREFQWAILDEFVTYMKTINAYSI